MSCIGTMWCLRVLSSTVFYRIHLKSYEQCMLCMILALVLYTIYTYIFMYFTCSYERQKLNYSYSSQYNSKSLAIKTLKKLIKSNIRMSNKNKKKAFYEFIDRFLNIVIMLIPPLDWTCFHQNPCKHLYCSKSSTELAKSASSSQLFSYTRK